MQDRILQVFYGNDRLPYKDKDRTVHYPITGNTFLGSSNVDKIRFYVRDIGGTNNITWVLNAKLPNGSILYQVLSTIGLDSELNEYYVEFSVSQFYTQLKGDTYIALNGCDGEVTITTDSETNIQTISATIESQTILTTGVIKFSNNYAPQRPLGFSFDLDQYQEIINALSSKSNVANTIQVIANITSEDLSGYDNGQLLYSLAQHLYYKKVATSPYYELADKGILGESKVLYRIGEIENETFQDIYDIVGLQRLFVIKYNGIEYLCVYGLDSDAHDQAIAFDLNEQSIYIYTGWDNQEYFSDLFDNSYKVKFVRQTNNSYKIYGTNGSGNQAYLDYDVSADANNIVQRDSNGQINVPTTPTQNAHATSKSYVDTKFVPYSGATQDVDLGSYSLKTNKVEIGDQYHTIELVSGDLNIGTGSGDIYLQPSGKLYYGSNEVATYSQVVSAQTTLQANIDASGHSLSISGGIDTDFEYTINLKDSNNNVLSTITFDLPLESVVISGSYDSANQEIVLTLEDGSTIEIPVGDLVSGLVSQDDFNTLSNTVTTNNNNAFKYTDITITGGYVAQLKKNGVDYPVATNVAVTTTPKVVATTSDLPENNDGYLYLVVADGYLYYWNNGAWVQGYEYATDLNQYVQTSRTIAGINLANDIGAQALTDALVFMNNTTDLDYVMED